MTGCSGTSKTGTAHHYYVCTAQKKKLCTKKAVRQLWIENLVLEYVVKLVQDNDLMEFIAENTYQYYLAQNTDTTYTKSLKKALAETAIEPLPLSPLCRTKAAKSNLSP